MSLHHEVHLEAEICTDLAAAGWRHDAGDAARYDRSQALFVDDVVTWVQTSQPKAWEAIHKSHGAAAPKLIAERLLLEISARARRLGL